MSTQTRGNPRKNTIIAVIRSALRAEIRKKGWGAKRLIAEETGLDQRTIGRLAASPINITTDAAQALADRYGLTLS